MNILYLTRNYESVQPRIIDELNRREGISAHMLFYHFSSVKPAREIPESVCHVECPYLYKRSFSIIPAFLKVAGVCMKLCREKKIDLIHCNMTFFDGHIARYCAKKLGIPYITAYRETDESYLGFWFNPAMKKSTERVLQDAQAICFLCPPYYERLLPQLSEKTRENVKKKASLVPNGIDADFLNHRSMHEKHQGLKLLFVGKVEKRKNLESLIKAAELLKEKYPVELDVVGKIVDEEYRQMIADAPFARYHEACPPTEVRAYLQQSDILAVPSHRESFGLVYPEAMSQGLPVIYTRGQGFDGHFAEGEIGYSVDSGDPADIAEKIELAYRNYERISQNCYEQVLRFSWEKVVDQFLKLYHVK